MKRIVITVVLGICCALGLTERARAGAVVLPAGSTVAGKTIGDWTADWWNWTGSVTANAFTDTTGASATVNQSGPVFFLAGTQGGDPLTRSFSIPSDKFVLFPLLNVIIANGPDPGFSNTLDEAKAWVDGAYDPAKTFATIDGTAVTDLASHREKSPANFTYTVLPGSSGFPAGTYNDANSDGYWIMLEPLSAGSHTIHFGGTSNDFTGPDPQLHVPPFTVDVTDNVRATGGTAIPLPPGVWPALPALGMAFLAIRKARRAVC